MEKRQRTSGPNVIKRLGAYLGTQHH